MASQNASSLEVDQTVTCPGSEDNAVLQQYANRPFSSFSKVSGLKQTFKGKASERETRAGNGETAKGMGQSVKGNREEEKGLEKVKAEQKGQGEEKGEEKVREQRKAEENEGKETGEGLPLSDSDIDFMMKAGKPFQTWSSYKAKTDEELSFEKGQEIMILEEYSDGRCRGLLIEKEGVFPKAALFSRRGGSHPGKLDSDRIATLSKDEEPELSLHEPGNGLSPHSSDRETPLSDLRTLLVVTYLEDACIGRPSRFKDGEKELRWYRLYNSRWLVWLLYLSVWVDLLLVLFEKPAHPSMLLPYWATMLVEIVCLGYFGVRIYHGSLLVADWREYWCDRKTLVVVILSALTLLDMLIYIIVESTCCAEKGIRITRALRPLFLVNFSDFRQIRKAFRNIRKTLPDVIAVLILVLITTAVFAILAVEMFEPKNLTDYKGRPYFNTYLDAFFFLYVLMTTANNPDVMMPAYNLNAWFSLFFIAFVCICMYIFMSIFLAVVYSNYKKHLKKEVQKSVSRKVESIRKIFKILKTQVDGMWVVTEEKYHAVVNFVKPSWSPAKVLLLWQVLDEKCQGYIEKAQFFHIVDFFNVEIVEVKHEEVLWERCCPSIYNSKISQIICKIIKHPAFRIFFDFAIVANAVFIGLDLNVDSEEDGEFFFLVLFDIEIALKFYAYGVRGFFRRWWNIFDLLIMGAATIALLVEAGVKAADETWQPSRTTLDVFMVLRVLRLVKIVGSIERFKVVIRTLLQIGPAISTYGAIMLVFFYFFAVIGMEAFGGKISYYELSKWTGNATNTTDVTGSLPTITTYSMTVPPEVSNMTVPQYVKLCGGHQELEGSDFSDLQYCKNNFNHFTSALVVLFDLTVVNQWHIVTQGFVLMTHWTARIYFLCFHLICVILVLNIFVAFILEAFMLQYESSVSKFETAVERKIEELGVGMKMTPRIEHLHSGPLVEDPPDNTEGPVSLKKVGPLRNGSSLNGSSQKTVQELAVEQNLRFRLSRKIQNAEILLQKMFEDELENKDLDADMEEEDTSSDYGEESPNDELGVGAYYSGHSPSKRRTASTHS
eukprot:m.123941 g.123941  ORF g.123941 m.123941 type:complete len:1059 (+) comp37843_c0_seq17:448-3624(+)